jgi:hypothetical protein
VWNEDSWGKLSLSKIMLGTLCDLKTEIVMSSNSLFEKIFWAFGFPLILLSFSVPSHSETSLLFPRADELHKKIQDYLSAEDSKKNTENDGVVEILYFDFTESEVSEIQDNFKTDSEKNFTHTVSKNHRDAGGDGTIGVIQGDISKTSNVPLFLLMETMSSSSNIVDLGPKIRRLKKGFFYNRSKKFSEYCTSLIFIEDGVVGVHPRSFMLIYSGADAGSKEQISCLKEQSLIYLNNVK